MQSNETIEQFTKRKAQHIEVSLRPENEALGHAGFDKIKLRHNALPEINFNEVSIATTALNTQLTSPYLISSMTAGHRHGEKINFDLASACQESGWLMGVGSQRRQLFDQDAKNEWIKIKKVLPNVTLLGNIGISQLITSSVSDIQRVLEPIDAKGIFVHANPLQEVLQPEGTPNFKNGLQALENLCYKLDIPVILKETGCGFSQSTLKTLNNIGLYSVDISGYGGTHWGRIEGARAEKNSLHKQAAKVFSGWGISTIDSMLNASSQKLDYNIWGSGGVRSGLDAAKLIALGAQIIGFAKPILQATLNGGIPSILNYMQQVEYELKVAMFCCGFDNIKSFQENIPWDLNRQ